MKSNESYQRNDRKRSFPGKWSDRKRQFSEKRKKLRSSRKRRDNRREATEDRSNYRRRTNLSETGQKYSRKKRNRRIENLRINVEKETRTEPSTDRNPMPLVLSSFTEETVPLKTWHGSTDLDRWLRPNSNRTRTPIEWITGLVPSIRLFIW